MNRNYIKTPENSRLGPLPNLTEFRIKQGLEPQIPGGICYKTPFKLAHPDESSHHVLYNQSTMYPFPVSRINYNSV